MDLTPQDALALRMSSLLLGEPAERPTDVAGVVTWFGAMQAQDLGSGLWSLGVRLPHLTEADVHAALEHREALRTWPMRGTVHLVPPRDARWMLALMGERALAGAAARRAFLGLDEAVADRAVDVLGEALAGGGRLTRAECVARLEQAGISSAGQLGYHLLWYASQRGVTCIAPNVGTEQTFVLLDEWVPDPVRLDRDEALATIAVRYFRSHGPTTRQDFAGWTGLTMADAKKGIAAAGAPGWPARPWRAGRCSSNRRCSTSTRPRQGRATPAAGACCPGSTSTCSGSRTARSCSPRSTSRRSSRAGTGSSRPPSCVTVGLWAPGSARRPRAARWSRCDRSCR